ncbi:Glutamate 5-kinase [Acetobacter pasteurianus subsp. pasteurianus]|uniref:Glutamate 5-kinase n=1 Tax=Acetobacter pasteurianus subsp. pasteurianus TaxID=481145 RepID=A0AAC9X1X6_ACEPA|nr:Glutamate 5-kinase [Acetobacter pasteurianus subsp. pasteurianus]
MTGYTSPSLTNAKRLVVKIGSALVVDPEKQAPRQEWLASVAADIAYLRKQGTAVTVVSSGAIALARHTLGLAGGALRLAEKQAAAAVGQISLAQAWSNALSAHGLIAAQLLLTPEDTEDRKRYLNARATLNTLLEMGCVPVINENDTVATAEIRFGDNDRLAARVAQMTDSDQLVLLSDIDGLYTADPRTNPDAQHLPVIETLTPEIEAMGGNLRRVILLGVCAPSCWLRALLHARAVPWLLPWVKRPTRSALCWKVGAAHGSCRKIAPIQPASSGLQAA